MIICTKSPPSKTKNKKNRWATGSSNDLNVRVVLGALGNGSVIQSIMNAIAYNSNASVRAHWRQLFQRIFSILCFGWVYSVSTSTTSSTSSNHDLQHQQQQQIDHDHGHTADDDAVIMERTKKSSRNESVVRSSSLINSPLLSEEELIE
jgi:hypothetical protein